MKNQINNEYPNADVKLILGLFPDEITTISLQEEYEPIQLTYCPVCCFDMRHEVGIRLAKSLANNIYRTSVEHNFDFKVEEDELYINNGSIYLKIGKSQFIDFIYTAYDKSGLPCQYRSMEVMKRTAILFRKLILFQK